MKKQIKKKHPFTVLLAKETYITLARMAEKESRPVSQMARVIIERALKRKDGQD